LFEEFGQILQRCPFVQVFGPEHGVRGRVEGIGVDSGQQVGEQEFVVLFVGCVVNVVPFCHGWSGGYLCLLFILSTKSRFLLVIK
jgi:hypothetical protein